jgi:hypothetical protein
MGAGGDIIKEVQQGAEKGGSQPEKDRVMGRKSMGDRGHSNAELGE